MTKHDLICESLIVSHTAFEEAVRMLEQCFFFAECKNEAEGVALTGESGSGKTSVIQVFYDKHAPWRSDDGMEVPVLFVTVPATPTVKSLAGVLLRALHDTLPPPTTENAMTHRIKVLMKGTGTRMIIIDEFQHFHDRGRLKIAHNVADWLKILIDQTRTTLVVAGLPSCMAVIDQNEQLARRVSAPIQLPRFDWNKPEDRKQFRKILHTYKEALSVRFDLPDLSSRTMAYRFWIATGGLIAYVSKILRHAERNAVLSGAQSISLGDLHVAHTKTVWTVGRVKETPQPFRDDFDTGETIEMVERGGEIGKATEEGVPRARRASRSKETVSSLLVAS